MKRRLRVLHVEDQERDVALLTRHLSRAGYALVSERVDTPEAMRAALERQEWDIILCDYSMPHLNAPSALALLQELGLEIPFIIISGTIGEDIAVEAMRAGANDYLMKDKLARLAPTIERELKEAENRRARRRAEAALKDSEAELRALFEAMTDVILVLDAEGRHVKMAPTRSNSFYKPAAERIGKTVHEVFPPETADLFLDYVRRALAESRTLRLEYRLSIDGRQTWFEGSVSPMTADSVTWVARDITERKHAEQQLRLQATALESAANAIIITDQHGIISWVNQAFTRLTGYKFEEVIGQSTNILRSGVHDEAFYRTLWDTILSGQVWHGEMTNLRKDGSLYIEEQTITPVLNDAGEIINFIGIKQDITERKTLADQLRQSQKLEAIGMLAGGIAHDFNNLLTVILGYGDLTLARLNKEDPLHRNISEVNKAAERAAGLTRQLLAFSRKQVLQPRVLDLNTVVSELEKMLRRLIGEDIGLRTVLESELGRVKADPGQIEQIIMNLAVNARDAMPDGGKLTIETENVHLDKDYAKAHIAVVPGPYVMLAVSDTGAGMDQETEARIFEPFFTTKEKGKGTGLGLSTVYGIVKQSDGNIWVYSEVGVGTTFKVYLPRVDEAKQESSGSAEAESSIKGTETILLAEDEEAVRKLARQILEMNGYQVLEAANGGAALLICERHPERIDLLITDVIMPEMSGRELADRLAQLRPEMKVLYMSGYTDNAIVHQGVLDEGANFIQKPFATDALARKVREVLDAPKKSL